jgi:hypothetical protein
VLLVLPADLYHFLFSRTRENFAALNMGCLFTIVGVYIEKIRRPKS